jgi:hypothetical protein
MMRLLPPPRMHIAVYKRKKEKETILQLLLTHTFSISNDANGGRVVTVSSWLEPSQSSRKRGSKLDENTVRELEERIFPCKFIWKAW